jgi:hypothetical protein
LPDTLDGRCLTRFLNLESHASNDTRSKKDTAEGHRSCRSRSSEGERELIDESPHNPTTTEENELRHSESDDEKKKAFHVLFLREGLF